MLRAFVLLGALLFFKAFLPRRKRRSPTEISPYMNSLDSLMSSEQISLSLDNFRGFRSGPR